MKGQGVECLGWNISDNGVREESCVACKGNMARGRGRLTGFKKEGQVEEGIG